MSYGELKRLGPTFITNSYTYQHLYTVPGNRKFTIKEVIVSNFTGGTFNWYLYGQLQLEYNRISYPRCASYRNLGRNEPDARATQFESHKLVQYSNSTSSNYQPDVVKSARGFTWQWRHSYNETMPPGTTLLALATASYGCSFTISGVEESI